MLSTQLKNNKMDIILKKGLSVFLIILVSTFLFYATPLSTYTGHASYGVIVGGSIGSFAGFPGVMIGGALGYFVSNSEEVNAIAPIVVAAIVGAVIGGTIGGFKASGGTCNVWDGIPEGGVNCDICNDKLMPCTEYYCKSLGKSCQYLNEEERCVEVESTDKSAPVVEECQAIDLDTRESYNVESTNSGCKILGEVPTFSTLAVKFDLDENARCKVFSSPGLGFDNSAGRELGGGLYDDEHFLLFDIGNVSLQTIEDCREGEACSGYIKCQDPVPNTMGADYFINFKLREAPDISKPLITSTAVVSGAAVPANVNEAEFFMYVDDKIGIQQCRYNKGNDVRFEEMTAENSFNCENVKDISEGGFRCDTTLKNITPGQENKYYFRCRDSSPRQNTMDQGFEFIIMGTEPLVITGNNLPQGTIFRPSQSLFVSTSAKSTCSYKLDSGDEKDFSVTDDTTSTLDINLEIGSHNMDVICTDDAGNQATISAVFNIDTPELKITEVKPKDTTVYTNIVPVTVKTTGGVYNNGNSTCRYGSGIQFNKNILTSETVHDANISLSDGAHTITVNCDDGFKQDEETTTLEVNSNAYPSLKRVYTSGGALIIKTDQPSTCSYSNKVKDFDFTTGLKMSTSNNVQHQLQLNGDGIYYVKCEDTRTKRLSPGYTIIP